jgi:integration host factor subunit alpha
MTKADLAEIVSSRIDVTRKDAAELVDSMIELIKGRLACAGKVKIAAFGNFEVKQKKDRKGRNPQTGEDITIEGRRVLSFKPSPVLRRSINQ